MRRTTLVLEDNLFRELKKLAATEGRSLSAVVNEVIQRGLREKNGPAPRKPFRLPRFAMGKPFVNLADRDRLYDRMEGR